MTVFKKVLIVFAWLVLGTLVTTLIGYVPGALDLIDDYRLGLLLGRFLLPTLAAHFVAGMLFINGKRRQAFAVSGAVALGYCALVAWMIVKLLRVKH